MIRNLIYLFTMFFVLAGCSSSVNKGKDTLPPPTAKLNCVGKECAVCNLPWGGTLPSGQTLEGVFTKELAECSETCEQFVVKLTCQEGKLGTLDEQKRFTEFTKPLSRQCYKRRCDCTQNGTLVEDGKAFKFFKGNPVTCGNACEERTFACASGKFMDGVAVAAPPTLSAFQHSACSVTPCQTCQAPWGDVVPHSGTVIAYKSSVAGCNTNCDANKITLTCKNGILSGGDVAQYKFKSCSVRACQNCQLASGDSLIHNAGVMAYGAQESTCTKSCVQMSKALSCNDGIISGGDAAVFKYSACSAKSCATCTLPCGSAIVSGGKGSCYKSAAPASCGQTCLSEIRTFSCDNGTLTPEDGSDMASALNQSYKNINCNEQAACSACALPDGRSVEDGMKATLFKARAVNCGKSCFTTDNAATLTCSNGNLQNQALYKDFLYSECQSACSTKTDEDLGAGRLEGEGGGAPNTICILPWRSGMALHQTRVLAFSRAAVPKGDKCSRYKMTIECNGFRGLWSGGGAYIYQTCVEER